MKINRAVIVIKAYQRKLCLLIDMSVPRDISVEEYE